MNRQEERFSNPYPERSSQQSEKERQNLDKELNTYD